VESYHDAESLAMIFLWMHKGWLPWWKYDMDRLATQSKLNQKILDMKQGAFGRAPKWLRHLALCPGDVDYDKIAASAQAFAYSD
jgi:hypothetical protein